MAVSYLHADGVSSIYNFGIIWLHSPKFSKRGKKKEEKGGLALCHILLASCLGGISIDLKELWVCFWKGPLKYVNTQPLLAESASHLDKL